MKPTIEVSLEAVVTLRVQTRQTIPEHFVQDVETIDDLKAADWFYEQCCDLIDPYTDDGSWEDLRADITLTRPNPNYAGENTMFGAPPATIVQKGTVSW